MKIDPTVKKETTYVLIFTLILSMLLESVFLIIRQWQLNVLFGNLLGAAIGIVNFFLLGLSVQKAVKSDEKRAREILRASQTVRFALMVLLVVISVLIPTVFNMWATLISLFFATIAVYMRPLFNKVRKTEDTPSVPSGTSEDTEGGDGQ